MDETKGPTETPSTDTPDSVDPLDSKDLVRRHLKVLLLHLAAKSDHPASDLEAILQDVILELHREVEAALAPKRKLRLVGTEEVTQ